MSAMAVTALLLAGPAFAQQNQNLYQPAVPPADGSEIINNKGIERRLDRDEQALRDLRQIVLQAKAQGNPVQVKDAGPDPALSDMQAKIDDFDQTLRRLNGAVEEMAHNLDQSRQALAAANAANQDLTARIAKLEAGQQQAQAGGASPPSQYPQGNLAAQAPPPPGAPDVSGDPGQADEILTYRQARQVLDSGDYAGGSRALQDYLSRYPNSPRTAEANYWLGRTLALQNLHADAAAAYARSLKGWPQSAWAGDSVVRLGASLIELKRTDDACKAVGEFDSRYAAKAATGVKTRARDVRQRAGC